MSPEARNINIGELVDSFPVFVGNNGIEHFRPSVIPGRDMSNLVMYEPWSVVTREALPLFVVHRDLRWGRYSIYPIENRDRVTPASFNLRARHLLVEKDRLGLKLFSTEATIDTPGFKEIWHLKEGKLVKWEVESEGNRPNILEKTLVLFPVVIHLQSSVRDTGVLVFNEEELIKPGTRELLEGLIRYDEEVARRFLNCSFNQ